MDTPKKHILRRWSVWLLLLLFGIFLSLSLLVDVDSTSVSTWFSNIADEPWAIFATVLFYVVAAFASIPQWMLHGGAILAFGSAKGAGVAWLATMISASVDFWLGRVFGADRVQSRGGGIVVKFVEAVRRYGFWASLVVRIVPTGPFVLINLAAGVSGMRFLAFFLGTAIGTIPKIIVVAFFGEGLKGAAMGRGPLFVFVALALGLAWMGIIYLLGRRLSGKTIQKPEI